MAGIDAIYLVKISACYDGWPVYSHTKHRTVEINAYWKQRTGVEVNGSKIVSRCIIGKVLVE